MEQFIYSNLILLSLLGGKRKPRTEGALDKSLNCIPRALSIGIPFTWNQVKGIKRHFISLLLLSGSNVSFSSPPISSPFLLLFIFSTGGPSPWVCVYVVAPAVTPGDCHPSICRMAVSYWWGAAIFRCRRKRRREMDFLSSRIFEIHRDFNFREMRRGLMVG